MAVGRGTGGELADVFERVLGALTAVHPTGVEIVRSPRLYHSYVSLREEPGVAEIQRLTARDADHYEAYCRGLAARGATALFRTAINAQSLYLVRSRLRAVKTDLLTAGAGVGAGVGGGTCSGTGSGIEERSLLLVRDQAQGFYTGENTHIPGRITRTMILTREITEAVIGYALERARRAWPDGRVGRVVMAYKFHLLDGAFDSWVAEAAHRFGTPIEVFQPDTVNRGLLAEGLPDRTVLVAGNEWADIMHVMLLDRYGCGPQETRCAENVFLDPALGRLTEYQTVHGSADDLTGLDRVNPLATIRAAAQIAEGHAGCAGAVAAMEAALAAVGGRGVRTADLGGRHSTTAVVDAVLAALDPPGARGVRTAPTVLAGGS
ncbi:isocitrate/isopropylmalate family dehydrogenase [Streptomyces sp. NPDC000594]|uniref:isocitrate/isopropylmalate family dehydrogenase n=1 Tax=Streptomyces sp. NPDC000594 TaxID=3154261 RepID=UPI00332F4AFC